MEISGNVELLRSFTLAAESFRVAAEPDDYVPGLERLWRTAKDRPEAAAFAIERLTSGDPIIRDVACSLLGAAANYHESVREAAATALIALAEHESDGEVLVSLARAVGSTYDMRTAPLLLRLAQHDDTDVRGEVASAIPMILLDDPYANGADELVAALIALSGDPDDEIRNWATFGLGEQVNLDGDAIRQALWERTSDPYDEARQEGIRGLARRRDRRVTPMLAELLAAESPESPYLSTFRAAAYLGDPALLPSLELYDDADHYVTEALIACDPIRRAAYNDRGWTVFLELAGLLPAHDVSIHCERYEVRHRLALCAGADFRWSVDALLARAGGDVGVAARLAAADVAEYRLG